MSISFVDLTKTNGNGFEKFVTEFGKSIDKIENFISSVGLQKTELIWNFLCMVEFSGAPIDGITPRNYMSDFIIGMLKAFEEFDQLPLGDMYPNGGIISKQFEALKCLLQEKKVELYIGKNVKSEEIGLVSDQPCKIDKETKCIFINFSEEMVKQQMKKPFVVIQAQNGKLEVKTITYEDLFPNCTKEELLKKCAAFFLFHELFHVGSFVICDFNKECGYDVWNTEYNYLKDFEIKEETMFPLFSIRGNLKNEADDARNTIWKLNEEREIPGEFELLNAICNLPTIRLYYGNYLNLTSLEVYSSCLELERKLLLIEPHTSQDQALKNIIYWTLENVEMNLYCKWLAFYTPSSDQIQKIKKLMLDIEKNINEQKALLVDFFDMPAINLQYLDNTVKRLKEGLVSLLKTLENKDINAHQKLKLCEFLKNVGWEINNPLNLEKMLNDMQEILKTPKDLSVVKEDIEKELTLLKEYISLLSIAYNYELKPKALLDK